MSPVEPQRRSAFFSYRFLLTAVTGSVVMVLVSTFGSFPAQLAIIGAFVSILGGLFLSYLGQEEQREKDRAKTIESLSVPLSLAADKEFFDLYLEVSEGLAALSKRKDPILRRIALLKFASVADQINGLADGKIVFAMTEAWRTVYGDLLNSPDIRQYRSVAHVCTSKYWQDEPGRQSMRLNFGAVNRGILIERIVLLKSHLWPTGQLLPSSEILPWIEEQHNHGIWVALVRESDLKHESDLLMDFGIYGDRAVGIQELDENCRTLRFTLDLDPQSVQIFNERWKRLQLYAKSFKNLLDQSPPESID